MFSNHVTLTKLGTECNYKQNVYPVGNPDSFIEQTTKRTNRECMNQAGKAKLLPITSK